MLRTGIALGCVTALVALGLASACTSTMDDCMNTSTCPPSGGSSSGGDAGNSSTSGKSGRSGSPSGGSANGGEGANASGGTSLAGGGGSTGAGEAGAGGAGGVVTMPCDGACAAPKPVCDEPNDTCVECLNEGDCAAGAKKKCDTTAKACVACLESTDCSTAAAAKCDDGACVKCTINDDCAHIAGKTVCDPVAGECVQCTGKDYSTCGTDLGTPLVCDTLKRTCTTNKKHAADLCKTCVSDSNCKAGQVCLLEKFGAPAKDVGYFCFWKKGDTANGAPAVCTSGRPYVDALTNQTSIDGTVADVCTLRVSTCTARNEFSAKDCSTGNAADDSKCGFDAPNDAKCVADGIGFSCTMTCVSADNRDCPNNIACNTSSGVCEI